MTNASTVAVNDKLEAGKASWPRGRPVESYNGILESMGVNGRCQKANFWVLNFIGVTDASMAAVDDELEAWNAWGGIKRPSRLKPEVIIEVGAVWTSDAPRISHGI